MAPTGAEPLYAAAAVSPAAEAIASGQAQAVCSQVCFLYRARCDMLQRRSSRRGTRRRSAPRCASCTVHAAMLL